MTIDTERISVRVLDRVIGAPIELVWKAWTDPEHFIRWWRPQNPFDTPVQIEQKDGGTFVICARSRESGSCEESCSCSVCKKVVPLEQVHFTRRQSGKDGTMTVSIYKADTPELVKEMRLEISFKSRGAWTELRIIEYRDPAAAHTTYTEEDLHLSIDKLIDSLDQKARWPIGRMSLRGVYMFWGGFILVTSTLFWFVCFVVTRMR